MRPIYADYSAVRHLMHPGDLIAFQGRGPISDVIRWRTRSPVTHVGAVYQRFEGGLGGLVRRVQLVESTSLSGTMGVQVTYLSDHLANYDGRVWWAPLHEFARAAWDDILADEFARRTIGKPYDFKQVAGAAIDWWDDAFENSRDFDAFFCSEWVSAYWQAATIVSEWINPSEQTPADVCQFGLFSKLYQLKGALTEIEHFNNHEVMT